MGKKGRVFLISLGCAKNLVDSEFLLGLLQTRGFVFAQSLVEAEIAVINTCGFIRSAVEETIDTVLEVVNLKAQGKLKKVVVLGCFVQRYGYKLMKEIPEVDGWLGTGEIYHVADILEKGSAVSPVPMRISRPVYIEDHTVPRIQISPFYSAYLKIADGCSHRCSYCIIPSLRGPYRSRGLESLCIQAEKMMESGVKEINLIAQDTTMYGKDLEEDVCLEDLLERLVSIRGIRWIRLLYCYPGEISDRLLELMNSEEAICPYLDLPLQHVNKKLLKAMGRNSASDFVKRVEFNHLGTFIFSREKGARAARVEPTVTSEVAQQRQDTLMTLQKEISKRLNQRLVGHTVAVLIEGVSPETDLLLKGRTETMAPDVDGQVLINKGEGVAGEIMPVLITDAHEYDLVGEIR
ncbi:MAG: MiaB/RimO family radical SAM methylthiotransferase [Deltaproteobacteria bacterium]|nr:MiaB/RimO family radical SAM methylthiotransferase [Deltaproteobacteria bacterium]